MSRHNKTGPDAIERERRRADALELREKGYSYRAIATELGVSLDTAHQDVKTAMAAITKEPAETVLALELARLDEYEKRLRKAIEDGDLDRIDSALRVQARRAKLLGLDQRAALQVSDDMRGASAAEGDSMISTLMAGLRAQYADNVTSSDEGETD
jgi:Zn-dependent oligopeptidase